MVSVRSALLAACERSRRLRTPGPIVVGLVMLGVLTSAASASAPAATPQPRLVHRDAVTVGADGNGAATARFGVFPRQNLRYALEVESGCPEPEGIPSQCPPPVGALEVSINGETVFAADGTFERDRVSIPVEALSLEDNELLITAGGIPHSAARIRILAMPEKARPAPEHRVAIRSSVTVGADGNGAATARFGVFPRQNLRYALEVQSGCPEPQGIPSQCPPPVGALEVSINGETVFAADGTFERDRVSIPIEALSLDDNELVITAFGSRHSAARIRILAMPENRRHRTGHRKSRS